MMKPELSIKVVGMGAAGLRLLGKLAAVGFPASHFVALDSDVEELQKCQLAERIQLGKKTRRGWSCGGDTNLGAECTRASIARISEELRGADLVLLLSGVSGGIGGGGAALVAEAAGREGALVMTIALQPFDLEVCPDTARLVTEELSKVSNALISIPNQAVMDSMSNHCSVQECIETSNIRILESLLGFGSLVSSDGLLNTNIDGFRKLIGESQGLGLMASVEMTGDFSAKAIVDSLLNHPFIDSKIDSSQPKFMVVNLAGGESIGLKQMSELEESLALKFPKTEKTLGLYKDKTLGSTIGVTLVALSTDQEGIDGDNGKETIVNNRLIEFTNKMPIIGVKGIQQQLPLVPVSKGCFDKGESNLHDGEDLDVPTFLRRNIILN